MKKKILIILSVLVLSLGLVGCGTEEKDKSEKVSIVVSINPLKEFAETIGGEKVEVKTLVPDGVEPHDFDPKPRDLEGLIESDVFVYNGLGMEAWIDNVTQQVNKEKTIIVDSSKGSNVIKVSEDDGHGHDHGDEDKHGEAVDPHIWLSLREAIIQSENIKNALVEADPENATYYEDNFKVFKGELTALDEEYIGKFKELNNKNFVTGHSAFGYLARDYELKTKALTNVFSTGESQMRDLENLVTFCKGNNIKTIFSEQSSASEQAETLARATGSKVEKIYSLETKVEGKSYIEGMKYNLEKIYENLKLEN